ncbi:MAG: NTP transferase domain-containing protein [Chloroflexota bacterium]
MQRGDGLTGVGVVVLAAGAGRRFGGGKLLADLEGRPLLQHALDAVRLVRPDGCVVVLGTDAERIRRTIVWSGETRVVNPDPDAGLAGSLRIGVDECRRLLPHARGVLVVLGDQPRTSSGVMRALAAAIHDAMAAGAWAVVPRYADGGGSNPVLVLPEGLARVPGLRGDRGWAVSSTSSRDARSGCPCRGPIPTWTRVPTSPRSAPPGRTAAGTPGRLARASANRPSWRAPRSGRSVGCRRPRCRRCPRGRRRARGRGRARGR